MKPNGKLASKVPAERSYLPFLKCVAFNYIRLCQTFEFPKVPSSASWMKVVSRTSALPPLKGGLACKARSWSCTQRYRDGKCIPDLVLSWIPPDGGTSPRHHPNESQASDCCPCIYDLQQVNSPVPPPYPTRALWRRDQGWQQKRLQISRLYLLNPCSAIVLQKLSVLWYVLLLKHQEEGLRNMEGKRTGKGIRNART